MSYVGERCAGCKERFTGRDGGVGKIVGNRVFWLHSNRSCAALLKRRIKKRLELRRSAAPLP